MFHVHVKVFSVYTKDYDKIYIPPFFYSRTDAA